MNELDIDSLFLQPNDNSEFEMTIPEKCDKCHNIAICSILPTLLSLSKIGIILEIKECYFLNPKKKK